MTSTKWIWKVISARFANNKSSFSSAQRFSTMRMMPIVLMTAVFQSHFILSLIGRKSVILFQFVNALHVGT